MWLKIVLGIAILIVVILFVREVQAWRAGSRPSTPRQRALRVATAILMVTVMCMMIIGDHWLKGNPIAIMAYWTLAFGLTASIVILALLDIREVGVTWGEEKKRIYRELAERSDDSETGEQ